MKKIFALMACLFALNATIYADNDKLISVNELPKNAQSFIKEYFSDLEVTYAKKEIDDLVVVEGYEVLFSNGTKVEFSKKGEWENVENKEGMVPIALIPTEIMNFLKQSKTDVKIIEIAKDKRGEIEVKVLGGLEYEFDKNFNLVDIND